MQFPFQRLELCSALSLHYRPLNGEGSSGALAVSELPAAVVTVAGVEGCLAAVCESAPAAAGIAEWCDCFMANMI